jgi:hypothetical protein
MKHLLPIAASCLLAGGAIGYIAGNKGGEAQENDPSKAVPKTVLSGSNRSTTGSGADAASKARNKPKTYEEVAATPGQTARLQALVDLYSGLTSEEFAGEADKLNDLPFNEQILAAYILFAAWAEVSPYEAFDHAGTKMGRTGMFVRPTILQSWAATDPKAAAQYFESNRSDFAMMGMMGGRGRGGSSGAGTVAGEWARQDPDGALAWSKTLEGREKEQATVNALTQIATTDPEKAAGLTSGLDGDSLSRANASIASEWAKTDWSATEAFVKGLPADQQGEALSAAVRSLADEDPTLASSKALEIPEGNDRDKAVESVAEAMARNEKPAEAAAWVMENGSEKAQRDSMRDVMGNWVNQDAAAARTFAMEQPEGAVRDSAVSSFVMSDTKGNPVENIKLAETISDEGSRGWAIGMTTMRWMGEDPEAATNYVENSEGIDERMKERILRRGGE